ncbi:MAG: sodium:solute symporter family transporter [Candidatus Amoebophilus sp.]
MFSLSSIDPVLFSTFLILTLIVGLSYGYRVKNLREYAIGEKDFSTATITSTIVATWIGGGLLFYTLSNTYTTGLHFAISIIGAPICLLLTGQFLAVRMGGFLNNFSVAEAMGDLYGPTVRIVTAISGILLGIGYVAIQFQVIGRIITLFLGVEGKFVTLTAAAIVIIYSSFGGIRSVTFTDILQFVAFSIFVPILILIVWNGLQDPKQVALTFSLNPSFNFRKIVGWNYQFMSTLGLMLYFSIPGINPTAFQRIAMARDLGQVKRSFTYAAGLSFLIYMFIVFLGIVLLANDSTLEPSKLVNYIIDRYAYPGLKGLIAIGITAMAMSTADSYLNSSTVLAVHDIIKPFKPSFQESIRITRISSLLLGGFALLLALRTSNILDLMLLAGSFYLPIVTVPFLLAIFGFRSTTRAVLIGMAAGFSTVACWDKLLAQTGINSAVAGMAANLIFFMGSHYILREKGGWIGIKEKEPLLAAQQSRRAAWKKFIYTIKHPHIYRYLQKNLPAYEVVYTLFAIYVIGATYASFFTIPEAIVANHQKLYDVVAHSVLIMTAGFLTYPAWPPTFKARWFITFAWPFGIFYILFMVGTILVLMGGFHQVQVMIFMLNLIMAAFLLSWPLMLFLATSGILIGCLILYMYCGHLQCTPTDGATEFKLIYGILLLSSFLIAIFRFREGKKTLEDKNTYLTTMYEDKNNEFAEILAYREQLLKELSQDQIELLDKTAAAYMQQALYRITDYIRLEVREINLDNLLLEIKDILKLKDFDVFPQLITKKHTKEKVIQADATKINKLLTESIAYIHKHNSSKPILIAIEDAMLGHSVAHMKDYTRKLKAIKITITTQKLLADTANRVYMFDQAPSISRIAGDGDRKALLENARIIDAHYGYAELDKEDTHVYVIPINVREVRGKVMELLREPAMVDEEELKHPLAIEIERELMDKVKTSKIDAKVITKALDTIKKYHAGVKRKSGEPFFTHPIAVALILLSYCRDQDAVVAALLHDTVEDTSLSMLQIKTMFGDTVAFIVGKVTNLEDKARRLSLDDHENIHRLINYEDDRAAYVKLADRLHNMRTISGHSSLAKQKHIANETLFFFVPLAKNLGLTDVSQELEKLSLEVLGRK